MVVRRQQGDLVEGNQALEKPRSNSVRDALQIDERQKINRFEFAVNRRGPAEPRRGVQVSAKQARGSRRWCHVVPQFASKRGLRLGAQRRLYQIFFSQFLIER